MRVLVCGGRDLDEERALEVLSVFFIEKQWVIDTIIHGNASGGDHAGSMWSFDNRCHEESFPADWSRYGKAAGMIRNKKMLTEGQPDVIVALLPGGNGTKNMIAIGRAAGVPVFEVETENG